MAEWQIIQGVLTVAPVCQVPSEVKGRESDSSNDGLIKYRDIYQII